jgi:hypothetical protein
LDFCSFFFSASGAVEKHWFIRNPELTAEWLNAGEILDNPSNRFIINLLIF